jgi:beta-galactosidase GanA
MYQINPLHLVFREELRLMTNAAAERGELLDMANVFAVDTSNHALFAREYLAHTSALEGVV